MTPFQNYSRLPVRARRVAGVAATSGSETPANPHSTARRRTGISAAEILAATALFAVITVLLVPVIGGVKDVRDEAAQHQLAVIEAANLMERVVDLRRGGPLSRRRLDALTLSTPIRERLTQPELAVSLGDVGGSPPARALAIEISWENQHGERGVPVRVVTFLYESEASGDAQP
jgi:hypothetical protein